ncbi:hypothetical protein ABPG75_006908 [Micractinium tetrahymenae]
MSAQTGRDSGIPGTAGQAGKTAYKEDVGLVGQGFITPVERSAEDYAPSREAQAKYGDVDKAAPNQPLTAAKQEMEEERGQTFTSATGKPTQPSPTNM